LDAYRGVAMDNAALSARVAVKAIRDAEKNGDTAIAHYTRRMRGLKRQMEVNERKRQAKFASDETLSENMAPRRMMVDGLKMLGANTLNRFLPPERIITLPL
jgi:flavin-dependent dehydrogenase